MSYHSVAPLPRLTIGRCGSAYLRDEMVDKTDLQTAPIRFVHDGCPGRAVRRRSTKDGRAAAAAFTEPLDPAATRAAQGRNADMLREPPLSLRAALKNYGSYSVMC